jgi:hypothetical protein
MRGEWKGGGVTTFQKISVIKMRSKTCSGAAERNYSGRGGGRGKVNYQNVMKRKIE